LYGGMAIDGSVEASLARRRWSAGLVCDTSGHELVHLGAGRGAIGRFESA
jgi:hypothetical protein